MELDGYYLGDGLPATPGVGMSKLPANVKLATLSSEIGFAADSTTVRLTGRYSLSGGPKNASTIIAPGKRGWRVAWQSSQCHSA